MENFVIYLGRVGGQANPTYFLFVFGYNIDCHQYVERIVYTTPNILLITVVII